MKDVAPHAFRRPTDEAIVERLARAIDVWRVDPAAAGFEHVDNAADHPAVIDARLAAGIRWQKRLKPRKLIVRQPKAVAIMSPPPLETVNHKIAPSETVIGTDF